MLFAWSLMDADLTNHDDALRRSRAPKTWVSQVRHDMEKFMLPAQRANWYALAQERAEWRSAIHDGLRRNGYKGLRDEAQQIRRNSNRM